MLVVKNGRLFLEEGIEEKDILIDRGRIKEIGKGISEPQSGETLDCEGNLILPGIIDPHVHFRTPGMEEKEDWDTGSRAAVSGGITTVLDMPNNKPPAVDKRVLREKRVIARSESLCNYGFHLGATENNFSQLESIEGIPSFKVFMASSTGNLLVKDSRKLKGIFQIAESRSLPVAVHPEDEDTIRKNVKLAREKGWDSVEYHSKIRPPEAEIKAVEKALSIQEEVGNRLHFCHISTAGGMELIKAAKENGKNVSCEVCPHHLFLGKKELKKLGVLGKVNPPLREKEDIKALWKAAKDGTVDCIATDHAPHTLKEKDKSYWEAPSGVPGVENSLALMLDAVNRGKLEMKRLVQLMSEGPARIYRLKDKGRIEEGSDADLTVVDLKKEREIRNEDQVTKCKWSPYNGFRLKGWPFATVVEGEIAFLNGEIKGIVRGKEVT